MQDNLARTGFDAYDMTLRQLRTNCERTHMTARMPTELDARIGQLLRQRRLELGLRQEDLAKQLNIAPHQLQKYETGDNRVSASRLVDCANALKVPVAWFYQSTQKGQQLIDNEGVLANDERELIEAYRSMSSEAKSQISSMAKLLANGRPGLGTKIKRP